MKNNLKKALVRFYLVFPIVGRNLITRFIFSKLFSTKVNKHYDPYQQEVLKCLDRFYRKNKYAKYIYYFERNKKWIYDNGLSKYFSWAAVVTKGTNQSLEYCCSAVSLNPRAINDITTAIIQDSYPDKEIFKEYLARAAFDSAAFSPIILTYILIKNGDYALLGKILRKEYIKEIYPEDELLESLSLIGDNEAVVRLFESSSDPSLVTLSVYEMVYDALTKLNRLEEAKSIFERADILFNDMRHSINKSINPHAINNKLERQFWFQEGNLIKAYATYKRQRLSQILANVIQDKYTQSLAVIASSKSPLILASWGPGDEIRFSKTYKILKEINPNITISCEPRLYTIFASHYPNISFLSVPRVRRVDSKLAHLFNRLPSKKLHHILDNETYENLGKYSHVCLLTDILSELIDKVENESKPVKLIQPKLSTNPLKVGISWTSSIQTANRCEHYFSVDDLNSIFTLSNAQFYSLQYGDCSSDVAEIEDKFGVKVIVPKIDQFNDFNAVLELMGSLDVILSVGTTVLELSGLSNTPVYALTNSKAFSYRAGQYNRDFWFDNIHYVEGFMELSKAEVAKRIVEKISYERTD